MTDEALMLLADTAAAWGWPLSPAQRSQFARYAAELQQWNERSNLTAITTDHDIVVRHFLDSLACAMHWGRQPQTLIDIGSGAGFPGIPLKLLVPSMRLTLVESVGKKAAFLQHIVHLLKLADVGVLQARAEQIGHEAHQREHYDIATVRAVGELRVLAEYALPLLRVGGRLLAPKGGDVAQEVDTAARALAVLGGRLLAVEPVRLPGVAPRTLVLLEKIAATPPHYPRAVGVPARRPL